MFITHADFMNKNYQTYIDTFSTIINTPLRAHIETVKLDFVELSKKDLLFLNQLALILFVLILLALVLILVLLTRNMQ
jgi:hypothetical protein